MNRFPLVQQRSWAQPQGWSMPPGAGLTSLRKQLLDGQLDILVRKLPVRIVAGQAVPQLARPVVNEHGRHESRNKLHSWDLVPALGD